MRPERRRIGMVGRISALGLSSGIETLASQLSVGVICFHGAVELSVDVSRSLGNGQSAVYGVIFAIPAVAYPFFDLCRKEIREKGLSYNSGLFEFARKGPAIRDRADKPGGVAIVEVFFGAEQFALFVDPPVVQPAVLVVVAPRTVGNPRQFPVVAFFTAFGHHLAIRVEELARAVRFPMPVSFDRPDRAVGTVFSNLTVPSEPEFFPGFANITVRIVFRVGMGHMIPDVVLAEKDRLQDYGYRYRRKKADPPRTEVYLCQDDRENEPDDAYEDA